MASMAVLSVAVCCTSAYISRADGRVGQSFGNDGRSGSVRTNTGLEGYRAENLGLIPPLSGRCLSSSKILGHNADFPNRK